VLDGLGQRRATSERAQHRERVPVYRPEQTRGREAEPGAPVHVGLEQRERERARDRGTTAEEETLEPESRQLAFGSGRLRSRTPTTASQTAAVETAAANASETSVTTTSRGPPAEASNRVVSGLEARARR
jgi:hypothetical protein